MKPLILLNLKVYKESIGENGLKLCKIAEKVAKKTGANIAVAPQTPDLSRIASSLSIPVFAQHVDSKDLGAFTGSITVEEVKAIGCKGTILNHSERKVPFEEIKKVVEKAKQLQLVTVICADTIEEAKKISTLKPDYIAIEPPELIGSGISVSKARPELIRDTVKAVKEIADIPIICGAGIATGDDVRRAVELGVVGVLPASAFAKAKDPEAVLLDMAGT